MKILHTADWHLGKRLDFFSRMEEQSEVMDEICTIADREAVDMVIVAGDLFDAFNPSTEAIDLLYKTLKKLTNDGKRAVIAIAGNHDSPALIDAPDTLARACGIIMIGYPQAVVAPMELPHFSLTKTVPGFFELKFNHLDYPVRLLHTAYANEVRLKTYLGEDNKAISLNQLLKENWQAIADEHCDENGVNLLTTHLFLMNKQGEIQEEPEGERSIRIGNADLIDAASIPSQIQYTALGHLHSYQNLGTEEKPIVYASSPLAFSFSETSHQKYVVIIETEPNQNAKLERIPLQSGRELKRKAFDNVDEAVSWLEENPSTLVELTMESDTFLSANDRKRILQAHSGIIHLIPKVKQDNASATPQKTIDLNQNMEELFVAYFKSKKDGQAPSEEINQLFQEILNYQR
ncbi:MAG TPA: exonuclease SbcCD subunit D [Moheibacter sp.]|nr:exonuclease SbcCD subunit D [Moheibacter sp.]